MSAVGKYGGFEEHETIKQKKWGDFTGRTGSVFSDDWYTETFESVREELSAAGDYLRFENMELPKDQILEKYDELEPKDGEYLEAELNSYPTPDGRFNILDLEKGEIEDIRVATTGYSFRPTVRTDKFPTSENEKLVDVDQGKSDRYTIMWEE